MGMETSGKSFPLQKIAKISKKKLYFSLISVKTMDIYMFFAGKFKNLARNLLKVSPLLCLLGFLIFPQSGLLANEWDKPVVLLEEPLQPAIELRDGKIAEVRVGSETEIALETSESIVGFRSNLGNETSGSRITSFPCAISNAQLSAHLEKSNTLGPLSISNFEVGPNHSYVCPEQFGVKSIANPGLFGFLGICLSRSELPSKNSSTPCENFPLKSMTQKSANDWKSSWQRVRTTSLWHMSTNSSRSQKTSIQRPSQSLTPSMSDTSSTWSNAMEESLATSSPLLMSQERKEQVLGLEKNPANSKILPLAQNPRRPVPNRVLL